MTVGISKKEQRFIYNFLKTKPINRSLEIGLGHACSAISIIAATKKHHIIDPCKAPYNKVGLKKLESLKKYYKLHIGNSQEVLPKLKEKFDFVFIDGDHKFDSVFVDFFYVDLLLNVNGYVMFHDAWMRPTQLVCSWIKKNKHNYKKIKSLPNMPIFQKIGQDKRVWYHFREFYTLKSLIMYNYVKFKLNYLYRNYFKSHILPKPKIYKGVISNKFWVW